VQERGKGRWSGNPPPEEVTVPRQEEKLRLGKSAAFVESRLKRLRQGDETWEADFQALPRPAEQTETPYLGLAVALPKGDPLVYLPVEYTPTVNDLADLLADAMRRPLILVTVKNTAPAT
jgi:hypothetical protein